MSTEETTLIAVFMGYEIIDYQHNQYKPIYNGNKYAKTIGELKNLWGGLELKFTGRFTERVKYPFNTDWNYLIPILKKIREIVNTVLCIHDYECFKELGLALNPYDHTIENVYKSVIDFINWLNKEIIPNYNNF